MRKARLGGSCVVLFYSDTTPGLSLPPLDVRSFGPVHIQVGAENSTFFSVFRLLTLFRLPRLPPLYKGTIQNNLYNKKKKLQGHISGIWVV